MSLRNYLITVTAVLAVLLVLSIWFHPCNSDFRAENPLWNGLQGISSEYHIQPLETLSGLPAAPYGTSLIIIPYLDFKTAELEQVRDFVTEGGRLILADDYGYGNQLLTYLGLEARFSGQVLLDPLLNYKNERLPRINRLIPDDLTANTDNLVFNHATCLSGVSGTEALAFSSPFSFLDSNDNGSYDDNEPGGPLPVISRHQLGEGQVFLIADPSLFINGMDNIDGNAALIRNLAASTEALYLDQSHLEQSELYDAKNWLQKGRSLASIPAGTAGLTAIALTASLIPVWHRRKGNNEPPGTG